MYGELPPLAVGDPPMLVEAPLQIDLLLPADAVGFELTVTVMDDVALQP